MLTINLTVPKYNKRARLLLLFSFHYRLHLRVSQLDRYTLFLLDMLLTIRGEHVIPNALMIKLTVTIVYFFKTNDGTFGTSKDGQLKTINLSISYLCKGYRLRTHYGNAKNAYTLCYCHILTCPYDDLKMCLMAT